MWDYHPWRQDFFCFIIIIQSLVISAEIISIQFGHWKTLNMFELKSIGCFILRVILIMNETHHWHLVQKIEDQSIGYKIFSRKISAIWPPLVDLQLLKFSMIFCFIFSVMTLIIWTSSSEINYELFLKTWFR